MGEVLFVVLKKDVGAGVPDNLHFKETTKNNRRRK
jgi:hypothetical protein